MRLLSACCRHRFERCDDVDVLARVCVVAVVLVVAGCGEADGGGAVAGGGDPCVDDPAVFEYCGDGDSDFDPNDPDLITWFDGIDKFNERQVEMWHLPIDLVGAELVKSTNEPNSSEWASCARYENGDRWWELCRRQQGTTIIDVRSSGTS